MEKFFYRVQPSETVFSVAQKLNIAVTSLIKSNRITRELSGGELLYIERSGERLYTVQPFDTLEGVAKKFNACAQDIIDENGVEYLFYGLTIKV